VNEATNRVLTGLLIAVAGAVGGAVVGWALGRWTKVIEYRVDLFQRACVCYYTAVTAIATCMLTMQRGKAQGEATFGPIERPRINKAIADLSESNAEARALSTVMGQVFSPESVRLWSEVLKTIEGNMRIEWNAWKELDHKAWGSFVQRAGSECGFRIIGRLWPKIAEVLTAGKSRDKS